MEEKYFEESITKLQGSIARMEDIGDKIIKSGLFSEDADAIVNINNSGCLDVAVSILAKLNPFGISEEEVVDIIYWFISDSGTKEMFGVEVKTASDLTKAIKKSYGK